MTPAPSPLLPGFIALHGNRAEDLAQALIAWLQQHPLAPLEEEIILVQSSGMAEWFKTELACQAGVCAAARVELPGRFIWRTYRQVLGAGAVPRESPLDKLPMTWRLVQLLPGLLDEPAFAPIAHYLQPGEPERLPQLAAQLADLFDQYQNYRADWLQDWAAGRDQLRDASGRSAALAEEQRWQPALWRAVLDTLAPEQRAATRPDLHRQVLERLDDPAFTPERVARRIVVFGMSHIPGPTLETLAGLARHSQVMLAVPNPCRFHWGDIMEGRELLRARRRRHPLRQGVELAELPLEDLHLHAHPLLAAWGRQGRDFIRQLDDFDDSVATSQRFPSLRIDLFDEQEESAATPLLTRVQQRIRDLEPLDPDRDSPPLAEDDRSILFHLAHSPVRELEVLHDQLLGLLAGPDLNPRDIVVMVPDVQLMAPAIRAVFGQYPRQDRRHIPFDIADLSARASSPVVSAIEWLLRLPGQRCGLSELVDLLEVPAVANRFGIEAEQLPQLAQWMGGAGIRWGLHAGQREQLDLAACGEQNSAWFGLQRMLLGYATGSLAELAQASGWQGIEPYAEVGGLDAELAGSLAHLLQALTQWWQHSTQSASPADWCERARWLLAALFKPVDELDSQAIAALDEGLSAWRTACDQAGFVQQAPLAALRQGWLEALEVPRLEQRFRAGGVTFCTLMPMRAIPFQVVCLLGMNDGDYPRRAMRSDFDLMGQPGQFRPGDRSRQHDDRQLMLEALLSARRLLYISWTGRSVRDNSPQPPSVLVSQLRDYLAAAWGPEAVAQRTTAHPLQPFSRRYFEAGSELLTYAREWRSAHDQLAGAETALAVQPMALPGQEPDLAVALTLERLARFLRNPVKTFFRERLSVSFWSPQQEPGDTEAFGFDGLQQYQLLQQQIQHWPAPQAGVELSALIARKLDGLRRSGALPMQGLGTLKQQELQATLEAMGRAWQQAGQDFPQPDARLAVEFEHQGLLLRDWIDPVYRNDAGERAWLRLESGKLTDGKKKPAPRADKLVAAWLVSLLAAACDQRLHGRVVGQDGVLEIEPMDMKSAIQGLQSLFELWLLGMREPLPLPLKTGLAVARDIKEDGSSDPAKTYEGSGDAFNDSMAEVNDMCLARLYPDFEALLAARTEDGSGLQELAERLYVPLLDWATRHVSARLHA
ncbi:MAG: exodeoxyribonuclease V subunit gamma [Burkholderiales bacterium RIFOXYC12_FULL_65_23]|uniref:exodeoxyribonuclease V subunit gamma n=1 Tax=Malikia spinosa TaxID=86180 RepID=UPI0008C2B548|nr:MAG: exodeoxyribonuclease V subunit gamma [Burkholderiales bacterium RIFOXYC12_FULL_65_23]